LHTRVVLTVTAFLYIFGVGGIFFGQMVPYIHEFAGLNVTANAPQLEPLSAEQLGKRVLDASFMSVSARTAGFNTINMDELTSTSRFVLMLGMWVGGSPGGTAGGVKTTVVAVLFLTIIATLRNREETEIFNRSVPETLVRRAGALVMLGFVVVSATTMFLSVTETFRFAHHVFEAISASSTVGLSMGLTPHLTSAGRIVIILSMFLGRVGPLALIGVVVFRRAEQARYRYPAEPVILG
jgi:trk system potassium uptake protein TrkH